MSTAALTEPEIDYELAREHGLTEEKYLWIREKCPFTTANMTENSSQFNLLGLFKSYIHFKIVEYQARSVNRKCIGFWAVRFGIGAYNS
jgi:hypothetical protein